MNLRHRRASAIRVIMSDLEIYKLKKDYKISGKDLKKILKKAEKLLKLVNLKISLAIVDDKTIRELNKKYRFRNKITDVLSFGKSKEFRLPKERWMGEIVISYPEAKRQARLPAPERSDGGQAKKYKESLQEVISRLFVHGLLHLAGYGHRTVKERKRMAQMELKILK